jgi:hypothetical protein
MAGTSVTAARSMSAMPMIKPGASVRRDSRLATSRAANAAMTVAAAEVITSPTLVSEYAVPAQRNVPACDMLG